MNMAVQHEFFNLANDNPALLIVPLKKSSQKCWSSTVCNFLCMYRLQDFIFGYLELFEPTEQL
jgi:hypothetical protein